ncbi:MAG: potassium transporter TrkG [Candidatus Aenigmatarchaeota archaeon]
MKELLANLGFLLQLSGFFIFIVAIISIYLDEIREAISFFLTASLFFILGFPLNALSERKEINFRESLILFFLTFLFLGLIGSIPYIYLDLFEKEDLASKIINSIFESVSGFTTTGISLLDSSSLSTSMKIYRAFTQFIGGIGIVYLLLTFLYSSNYKVSRVFNKLLGFDIKSEIKKNVLEILVVFSLITISLSLLMYYFNEDIIKSFCLVMSGISTGGFSHYDLKSLIIEEKIILIVSMIFGSISLLILSKFKKEIIPYIVFILILFLILSFNDIDVIDSLFHSVSLISTTGYSYIDYNTFSPTILFIFSILMLIGGMAISTSGGIKIIRIINSIKYIAKFIKGFIKEEKIEVKDEKVISLSYLFCYLFIWIIVSIIFSFYTNSLEKSLFDAASILSTGGFSSGLINSDLALELKILIIFLMILGRIEIIPIFAIFIFSKNK